MRQYISISIIILLSVALIVSLNRDFLFPKISFLSPKANEKVAEQAKPLDKYAIDNLKNREFSSSLITIDKQLKSDSELSSNVFFYESAGKRVSGLINTPKKEGVYPVILMFRGFVPDEIFTTGEGTRRTGEALSQAGFITLAPDFLGFGESASESSHPLESRFETYTTALNLLASISNLNAALSLQNTFSGVRADPQKLGIWGHSNGGHIALVTLEVSGSKLPTVLWAPVTKPFPYSILYYSDESEDNGKLLRKLIADFERDYDVNRYSLTTYLDWIESPIELHQGTNDEAVPLRWSSQFVAEMQKRNKDISYFIYPGEVHNFNSSGWLLALARSVRFYTSHFSSR